MHPPKKAGSFIANKDYLSARTLLSSYCQDYPDDSEGLFFLGISHLQLGNTKAAIEALQAVVKLEPGSINAWYNLGIAYRNSGTSVPAITCFKKVVSLNPGMTLAFLKLAELEERIGQHDNVINYLSKALKSAPDNLEVHLRMGNEYLTQGRLADAKNHFETCLNLAPAHPQVIASLAKALIREGQYEEANNLLTPLMSEDCRPEYILAACVYADISDFFGCRDITIKRLEHLASLDDIPEQDLCQAYFALGKLLDRTGDYDNAFLYFRKANQLKQVHYNFREDALFANQIISSWTHQFNSSVPRLHKTREKIRPVFIIGMPRSGTSLVEQILASHPQVTAMGELTDIPKLAEHLQANAGPDAYYPNYLKTLTIKTLTNAADSYINRLLPACNKHTRLVTDKLPFNFWYVGLIHLLFPKAKIIHCTRGPLDTCLSCYFQDFSGGNDFACDLESLGLFYQSYQKVMDHWDTVLDVKIHTVSYEKLIKNPENIISDLLRHCGLKWDSHCLDFHKTARPVVTASHHQVRQPIYTHSTGRWKHYENHIGPLRKGLHDKV